MAIATELITNPYADISQLGIQASQIDVRAFDPRWDADYVPRSYSEQEDVMALYRFAGAQLLAGMAAGMPETGHALLRQAHDTLKQRVSAKTDAIAGYLSRVIAPYDGLVYLDAKRDKEPLSVRGKIWRLEEENTDQEPVQVWDSHGFRVVTQVEDPNHAWQVLENIRIAVNNPEYRPNGKPVVDKMGNQFSSPKFEALQGKFMVVVDGAVTLFEVQSLTLGQKAAYDATWEEYARTRGYNTLDQQRAAEQSKVYATA